jgi:hypothetical protein
MTDTCINGDPYCGKNWTCGKCKSALYRRIRRGQSAEDRAYDDYVDPRGAYHLFDNYEPEGCSCHINPPCAYCVNGGDNE